ncbi:DUF5709 domain-containing protein [Streptantibioticus silvisoli]
MSEPEIPDEEMTGDEVYQPQPDEEVTDDAGVLDPEDTLDDRGIDPALDEGYSPPEKPLEVDRRGTTVAEQREGESLDQRLAEELPDQPDPRDLAGDGIGDAPGAEGEPVDPQAGEERSGRLIGTDEGVPRRPGSGVEDVTATDAGLAGGAASAEEAAVHTVEDEDAVPFDADETGGSEGGSPQER